MEAVAAATSQIKKVDVQSTKSPRAALGAAESRPGQGSALCSDRATLNQHRGRCHGDGKSFMTHGNRSS